MVLTYATEKAKLVFNADVTIDPNDVNTSMLFGGSVAAQVNTSSTTSIGGRLEYLDGSNVGPGTLADDYLVTITGTNRYAPNKHLVLSFEPRIELAETEFFPGRETGDVEKFWAGFIVGASGHFGN